MIEEIILTSLWIWGIHGLFNPEGGLLFNKVGYSLERILGTVVCKPLFLCPPCQSSVHGTLSGLFFFGFSLKIIPFIICLTGLNYVIKTYLYPEYEETSPDNKG